MSSSQQTDTKVTSMNGGAFIRSIVFTPSIRGKVAWPQAHCLPGVKAKGQMLAFTMRILAHILCDVGDHASSQFPVVCSCNS